MHKKFKDIINEYTLDSIKIGDRTYKVKGKLIITKRYQKLPSQWVDTGSKSLEVIIYKGLYVEFKDIGKIFENVTLVCSGMVDPTIFDDNNSLYFDRMTVVDMDSSQLKLALCA